MGSATAKLVKLWEQAHILFKMGDRNFSPGEGPGDGRIRRAGAGRKCVLPQHPEWTRAVVQIIEPHTAGLPQDENVVWISLSVTQIINELSEAGYDISRYFVRQILDSLGLRERSFYKDLPMKEVKNRDEQFQRISSIREEAEAVGLPIISIDTKKKEMLGNFKREGKAFSNGQPLAYDHDFSTFSDESDCSARHL
jgi:Rhodopirellula transposase.